MPLIEQFEELEFDVVLQSTQGITGSPELDDIDPIE